MKKELKEKARTLRYDGKSMKWIAKELDIGLSTISYWVRDIKLTDEQLLRLRNNQTRLAGGSWSKVCRDKRKQWQKIGKEKVKNGDAFYAFNCALFWGEGSKTKNQVTITNTDVNMLKCFLSFLKKYFDVKNEDISLRLNVYLDNGLTLEEIQNYWCQELELPKSCFRKSTIKNKYYTTPIKVKYPYGVCAIRVGDTSIIQQIYGSIKEITDDNSDKWLF